MEIAFDMAISCFQLISTSLPRYFMKTTYFILYENSLTLFYLLL